MISEKSHETNLRRKAERQGLRLVKSKRRDPLATTYGLFTLVDEQGRPAERWSPAWQTLEVVERFLTTRPEER